MPNRRRLAWAAALVAIAGAARAQDPPPTPPAQAADVAAEVDAARRKAVELTAAGDFAAALETLRDAAKRVGPCAALTTSEGVVFLAQAKSGLAGGADDMLVRALHADAAERARRALAMDPEHSPAAVLAANARAADGDAEGARADLAAWIEKRPKDAVVRFALADMFFAARDWSGADLHYTRGLELVPANGMARLNQTTARHWMRVPMDQIERGYLEAARLLPDADRPLSLLAGLHPKERDKKLELLRKVVLENPKAVWARVWIAYVLRKEPPVDAKAALAVLREAQALAPDDAAVHRSVAETLEETGAPLVESVEEYALAVEKGRPGEAVRESDALDRLLHMTPGGEKIPRRLRERAYDAVCAKNPQDGRYGNNAGFWMRGAADYEKSLKYYLFSVKAGPDEQDYVNDTALIYLFHLTDRKDRCLPMLEHVVDLVRKRGASPRRGYWDALENLCKYWFEKGDYRKVVEFADLRADPTATMNGRPYPSGKAADWKARALRELGK